MICRITAPMRSISMAVNLSPLAKLHAAQAGLVFDFICGMALSILSNPLGLSLVPQYTQGLRIISKTSAVVMSHSSIFLYALRKDIARPLSLLPYRSCLALFLSRCSGVIRAYLSGLLSLPAFRLRWHGLHSYAKPRGREASRKKTSDVAGKRWLHLLQKRKPSLVETSLFRMDMIIT